jgi:glucosamine 6-phosphate synthetase-like amidotransferase/phosphosugar isomerase protein
MCGLVGIAGKLTVKDEATMKRLFLLDFFRGPDSTGLAAVRGDGNIHVSKLASHPIDLFDSARFKTALSGYNSKIFLGHNRYATKGKVNANNAHPYHYGDIVGAHNGTLSISSWRALEKLSAKISKSTHRQSSPLSPSSALPRRCPFFRGHGR